MCSFICDGSNCFHFCISSWGTSIIYSGMQVTEDLLFHAFHIFPITCSCLRCSQNMSWRTRWHLLCEMVLSELKISYSGFLLLYYVVCSNLWSLVALSCSPNLANHQVLVESMDCQLAHIGLFASRDVSTSSFLTNCWPMCLNVWDNRIRKGRRRKKEKENCCRFTVTNGDHCVMTNLLLGLSTPFFIEWPFLYWGYIIIIFHENLFDMFCFLNINFSGQTPN